MMKEPGFNDHSYRRYCATHQHTTTSKTKPDHTYIGDVMEALQC